MFKRYVTSISYGYCKSRSGCCTCCNSCTLMLQASVLNVSSVFSDVCCKCVYLDVAYVFIHITHMMQVFYLDVGYVYKDFKCFSGVFASVPDAYFKCFICFQTYIGIVATRSSVASPSSPFYCITSVSGVGRQRRSPLAWVGPTCLRVGIAGETWDVGRGMGDSGASIWTGG